MSENKNIVNFTTFLEPTNPGSISERFDYSFFLRANNTQIMFVGGPTNALNDELARAIQQCAAPATRACHALGLVIDRMKQRESYSNHYRDYLLGQISEGDFEKVATEYAYTPARANVLELAEDLRALLAFTTQDFTNSEVAELFRVDESDVTSAMAMQLPLISGLVTQAAK